MIWLMIEIGRFAYMNQKKKSRYGNRSGMTENGLLKAHFVRSASSQDRPPPTTVEFTEHKSVVYFHRAKVTRFEECESTLILIFKIYLSIFK